MPTRARAKERSEPPKKPARQPSAAAGKAVASKPTSTKPAAKTEPAEASQAEPGARRTQAERTAVSNQRLLAAAVKVIAGKGYRAASLQAIGEAAGYSRGLVSHRFGSKEGLLKVLLENVPDLWSDKVRDLVGLEALKVAIRTHHLTLAKTPDSVRALYMVMYEAQGELVELREGFAERDRMYRARIEKVLRAGQREKTIRKDVDVEATATLFLSSLRGITVCWLMDRDKLDLDGLYAELEKQLVRTLGS